MNVGKRICSISVVILSLIGPSVHAQVTRDQAQQIAYAFASTAANGPSALVTVSPLPWNDRVTLPGYPTGFWPLQFSSGLCDVRESDGRVSFFIPTRTTTLS